MRNRLSTVVATAVLGPVAGGAGLAAGHLLAAFTKPASSPVLAVGSVVIDHTPTPMKEWAISHFGTNDKTILIGSVLVVVLLLSTVIGPLARRSTRLGAVAFIALPVIAAVCALSRPESSATDVLPSLLAAVVAEAVLLGTLRLMARGDAAEAAGSGAAGSEATAPDSAAQAAMPATMPATMIAGDDGSGPDRRAAAAGSRRTVLIGLGAVAVAAAAVGELGRKVIHLRAKPEDVALPAPASAARPLPTGLDRTVPGITPFVTPNHSFYRVDTRLDVPVVDSSSWRLSVDGMVDHPFDIGFDDLLAMPLIERDITLTCVSNSVGGPYVGGARWLGVRLKDLLGRAGVHSGADQILSTDVEGMTISTPLALATDGRDAMLAVGMNGEALPREHGFPVRMVIPGLYGFISATKWVTRLTLTTYADHSAYWTHRGWATDAPIKISSRIDTPRPLDRVKAGDVVVGGVAWAQESGGVAKVEVRIDDGPWVAANLGPSGGNDYWRQWFYRWSATPGDHMVSCRVTDGAGQVQSTARALPFPDGSSGLQSISVTAA